MPPGDFVANVRRFLADAPAAWDPFDPGWAVESATHGNCAATRSVAPNTRSLSRLDHDLS